mgnify:CR=1 FL=1
MNPFTPNLKDLSDDDLLAKINDLYSKMRMMMNNPPVYNQMQSIMHDYQMEQQSRMEKRKQELDNSELSKKIDIGK